MSFTVVFNTINENRSYLLSFRPTPMWIINPKQKIVVTRKSPQYQLGGVKKLLKETYSEFPEGKKCVIIIHSLGYGSKKDLQTLQEDLTNEGFEYEVFNWSNNDDNFAK